MHRIFLCLIAVAVIVTCCSAAAAEKPVRLHIIAEDNSESAQALKYSIRDEVLAVARKLTEGANSEAEAYAVLFKNLDLLRLSAKRTALASGYEGAITVEAGIRSYPARLYGNTLLPAGEYPGIEVRIGRAEGKNWWCVIFPSLCYFGERREDQQIEFYSSLKTWFSAIFY